MDMLIHMRVHIYIHICERRLIYFFFKIFTKIWTHCSTKRDFSHQNRYSLMDVFRQVLHLFSTSCDRGDGFTLRTIVSLQTVALTVVLVAFLPASVDAFCEIAELAELAEAG